MVFNVKTRYTKRSDKFKLVRCNLETYVFWSEVLWRHRLPRHDSWAPLASYLLFFSFYSN